MLALSAAGGAVDFAFNDLIEKNRKSSLALRLAAVLDKRMIRDQLVQQTALS